MTRAQVSAIRKSLQTANPLETGQKEGGYSWAAVSAKKEGIDIDLCQRQANVLNLENIT